MTFFLGQRFRKKIRVLSDRVDFDYGSLADPAYYWVIEFANRDTAWIAGFHDNRLLHFDVPQGTFTEERIGPLKWKVTILDFQTERPTVLDSRSHDDILLRNLQTAQEQGLTTH